MDSSSDGSFAWTDASDDSTADEMAKTNKNASESAEESESGKSYKKKLQQELFSAGNNDIIATLNENEASPMRKRKLSQHHPDTEHYENPKKRSIKTEPESDVDKQKKKHLKTPETYNHDSSSNSYDESFLESKVKNEQIFAVPSPIKIKKNKRKSVNDISVSNRDILESQRSPSSIQKEEDLYSKIHYEEDLGLMEEDENKFDTNNTVKKKKSKKTKEHSENEEQVRDRVRDSFSETKTVEDEHVDIDDIESHSNDEQAPDTPRPSEVQSDRSHYHEGKVLNGNLSNKVMKLQNNVSDTNTKRKSRMSQRITFEDEDSDVKTNASVKTNKDKRYKLDRFLESSIHLRSIGVKLPSASVLSDNDDVWVIRCPKDVNVEAFQDKKLILDSKCKIKLDGQTYEGDLEDKNNNMTILSERNGKAIIKSLPVNGCIRLRRRIPKTHIQDNNIMVNNQNNFIPLPETKCRHPLFGLNYKKAIKLPSAVAERLRAPHSEPVSTDKNKRKSSRGKFKGNAPEPNVTPKSELVTGTSEDLTQSVSASKKQKKRKRRRSEGTDEASSPRPKKLRHNPESAEAWDSEKAIEENLFNF